MTQETKNEMDVRQYVGVYIVLEYGGELTTPRITKEFRRKMEDSMCDDIVSVFLEAIIHREFDKKGVEVFVRLEEVFESSLVCETCGSVRIEHEVCGNVNGRGVFVGDVEGDSVWCLDCERERNWVFSDSKGCLIYPYWY